MPREKDPVFDKMFAEAAREQDPDKYIERVRELDVYYAMKYTTHKPYMPKLFSTWWPWLNNYAGEVDVGYLCFGPTLARIWIDEKLKKKLK